MRKRQPYWRTLGTPATLVLYRTPGRRRYAIRFTSGGVADGALAHPDPSCEPEIAQVAMHREVEELTHRELEVTWNRADEPDWWTGVVIDAGPLPPP